MSKYCLIILALLCSCVYLDSVTQPSSVEIGERFTITVNGNYNSGGYSTGYPWLAMMLPNGFLIDSVRYTYDTLTHIITQHDTSLSAYLDNLFPCDSNMHWQAFWGEYASPYPETIGVYTATVYAMATDSATPGAYLIDYLSGTNGLASVDIRDSIFDQPLMVTNTGVQEFTGRRTSSSITAAPTIFRNTLHIVLNRAGLVNIVSNDGRLVKSFDQKLSIQDQGSAISWHGDDDAGRKLPSGVYFVKFTSGDYEETEKVLLVR